MSAVTLVEPAGMPRHAAAQSQHISKAMQSGPIVVARLAQKFRVMRQWAYQASPEPRGRLAISDSPEAARRQKPRPIHVGPITATGVPKPEAPSREAPNENAIQQRLQATIIGEATDGRLARFRVRR